ncbi:hypothetical protein [Mucilaginibacter gotjawali]|uniref:Uncharacterized protein n=2 Tax=Mucilaginibacter gotjawali TaxID=1550579 RepID=A0A839SL17_9SPHI|nr:hypothetical protein [Mucilaginibacter gotjawali]MBB3057934.1 hypothetical protein [Mucilaginibacter gotjawali]BAU52294.1 hypothetical protein MgSA37_00449 [Mucilaginibacter gotjawali]
MKKLALKPVSGRSILLVAAICLGTLGVMAQAPAKKAAKALVAPAAAKPIIAPKSVPAIIDAFFKKYKDKGADTAIDYLFGTNKLLANLPQLPVLKAKLDSLPISAGKYMGHELIAQKSASPSLFFYSYLVKFENQPYRFTFMFYKPGNEWELYRFKYDDQLDSELEEAGKINNKHP